MYIGSAGPGRADGRTADGRTGGRQVPGHGRADGRADERAAGTILNDSTTIFIDFHKKTKKTLCFSVVSHPADAQVPIFTAQMKKASKKCQKTTVFFDFSNHARAQVPIFTPKMKKIGHGRRASRSFSELLGASRSQRIHRKRDTERGAQPPEHSRQRSG